MKSLKFFKPTLATTQTARKHPSVRITLRTGRIPERSAAALRWAAILSLLFSYTAQSATVQVRVREGFGTGLGAHFNPLNVDIHVGDTVQWSWVDGVHSVVSGNGSTGIANGIFNSGVHSGPYAFSHTFPSVGTFPYFCAVHRRPDVYGNWPSVRVTAAPPETTQPSLLLSNFNGDAYSDYLLFSPSTRRTAIWYLNGNTLQSGAYGPTLPPGWAVVALADFNQNGTPDYVLYNATSRQTAVWFLNNATFVSGNIGPTLPAGWKLIAAADINLDNKPDYVLFNPTTRQSAVWYLNGTAFINGALGPTLPAGWTLVDVRDFDSNNHSDYVLFNASTGQTAIWYLNGSTVVGGAYGPALPMGWTLKGAADFNSDTKPDYVLFEASTRRTAIWYLNGLTLLSGALGPTLPASF